MQLVLHGLVGLREALRIVLFDKRDQMMRQNFNDEDKRILRQFGFSVGLAIIGVIIVIALV